MLTLPFGLPAANKVHSSVVSLPADVDVGGYDIMLGGYGFRLATDQQNPYERATEPTTTHRFDSSLEPGEQSLSALPWIKSQASFHGGAGQLNLEQGFTAFQYQQEQVEHIRFDTCLGVDVWTPGQVTRLPTTRYFNFGFNSSCMVTASVGGVDYAIIGGNGGLYQLAWLSGADADPTVTAIDLSDPTYGGASNCNITSLATDGVRYFGVLQMTTTGSTPGLLTYIISGSITSPAMPTPIYEVPGVGTSAPKTNLCANPNFESGTTTGWSTRGVSGGPTLSTSTAQFHSGTKSCLATFAGSTAGFHDGPIYTFATVNGTTYTCVGWALVPSTSGASAVQASEWGGAGTSGTSTTATDTWQQISVTFTATSSSSQVIFSAAATAAGQIFYLDDVLIITGSTPGSYFDGSTPTDGKYTYSWTGTANLSTSKATPVNVGGQALGIVGWVKARLVGCAGTNLYELDANAAAHTALPGPKYTHPSKNWLWSALSESPTGILAAGAVGGQSSILEFTLDTSGGTPFLAGGTTVAVLPIGETITDLESVLGSFLGIATNKGVRVGTFDTYTGALKYGPTSLVSTASVLGLASRDRFLYAGHTNQQADGKTGLARIDLSMVVDAAGRNAWAPDLRPPTTAPTGLGAVTDVEILPMSGRMVFVTPEGIHVEGNGPGSDGDAWIRTSRIRYDTAEPKLFKLGRLHGTLDVAEIQVTGIAPFQSDTNLGLFGFLSNGDPGEFRLPAGLNEWIQLKFTLIGSNCVLNTYQVKALPAPKRQHLIILTVNCFRDEVDRFGLDVTDPETPRQRLQNVLDLEAAGNETRFVEFTNQGAVAQLVVIDQVDFRSYSRPNVEDDLGGYITFHLRTTEN